MVKNHSWQEADQLAIYKHGWGVELGATEKQLQLVVRAGLEPRTSRFQGWCPNHSTMLPHYMEKKKDHSKGYWNPKRKLEATMHFQR